MVPSKTIPDSRQKWAKCTPFFRPKRRKNTTRWGTTYLHTLYKVVIPSPPPPGPAATQATFDTDEKSLFGLSGVVGNTWLTLLITEEFWLDFYSSSHGGSIWSDISGEILRMQVTCVSYHVNNYQNWITCKVFCFQVDIFLIFSQNNRDQSSKKSFVGAVNVIRVSLLWNDRKRKNL